MRLFDGHCDTISRCLSDGSGLWRNGGELDLARTRKYESYGQFFAIFADREKLQGAAPYEMFQRQYRFWTAEAAANREHLTLCRSAAEAERAFSEGKTAAFLSVEGAELLHCDLALLEHAHQLGVRAVNLTWNHPNALSGTSRRDTDRGLSGEGRAFVRRMQALGMLVDVSHLSDPGFWDVMALAEKPIMASHSNARALCPHQRNLTDAQFTAIIKNGGLAGLNLYCAFLGGRADMDRVVAHAEHFWALGGEKHVCMGGDWDGQDCLPAGIGGVEDLDRLYDRFLQKNYSQALVDGLFFTNLMKVVSEVCTISAQETER